MSTLLQTHEWCSVSTGPGEPLRSWPGLDTVASHSQFGSVASLGSGTGGAASCCACVHSGLGFSGHLPHCLGGRAAVVSAHMRMGGG